jgi:ferric-dicitrate binding protein FerR (iron transport regulator)
MFEDYRLLWEHSGQIMRPDSIDTEIALAQTKRRIKFKKTNLIRFFQRAAAVLFLAVLLSATYIHFYPVESYADMKDIQAIEQEISTVYGTRSTFKLSDGTRVYLNSGSKLKFPLKFNGNSRKVELIGEAFFEVTPNPSNPFIVKTSAINIKVLGTEFNLRSNPASNEIITTLVHGKVVLEKESDGLSTQLAELKPSEQANFKINQKTIGISTEEDLDKFIGWKDGKLVFFNDPINEVADKLGHWYNVTVSIGNSNLMRYRFTATFSDEPIEQVLDLLSKSSPIKYQIKKAVRLPDNSYSKREIIFN